MEYIEIEMLKQSERSTVQIVREKDGEQVFIKKRLKGYQEIYETLKDCLHVGLPKLYEVELSDNETIVIEEYIKGQPLGSSELSEQQLLCIVRELCSVLKFLHGRGIIHRDIKPSNIILAQDGHIRLIDFDAARMPKGGIESDTRLLGTRGYAPPEQYGFAQTDVRTDIYSLGVTLEQIFGDKANKPRYRRIIKKCVKLDPDKRYQSVRQVERAFFHKGRNVLCGMVALVLAVSVFLRYLPRQADNFGYMELPAPENPRWDGDTGIALWENVEEADSIGEAGYSWRLYRQETDVPPDLSKDPWVWEGDMKRTFDQEGTAFTYRVNLSKNMQKNGFYYFAVSTEGDQVQYADSPYVISDAFEYKGESAPLLPDPTGLEWDKIDVGQGSIDYFAVWSNLDDYEDADSFNVRVYNASGDFVGNNIWSKEEILSIGQGGIWIDPKLLIEEDGPYRFTVQVYSSRPNEFRSTFIPNPVPEECYSPWSEGNVEVKMNLNKISEKIR